MDLKTYVSAVRGRVAGLAKALGVPSPLVSQWASGNRPVPAERCIAIEEVTAGVVRCEDLRKDINWEPLRSKPAKRKARACSQAQVDRAICGAAQPDYAPRGGADRRRDGPSER